MIGTLGRHADDRESMLSCKRGHYLIESGVPFWNNNDRGMHVKTKINRLVRLECVF